jgi:hypothetical protein
MIDKRLSYSGYDKILDRVRGIIKDEIPNGFMEEIIVKNLINKINDFETEIENIIEGRETDGFIQIRQDK